MSHSTEEVPRAFMTLLLPPSLHVLGPKDDSMTATTWCIKLIKS